jgi:hypothetical protein
MESSLEVYEAEAQLLDIVIDNPVEYERELAQKAKDFASAHSSITRELIRILYEVEVNELWKLNPNRYISLRDWADQNIAPYLEESAIQSISSWCGVATMLVGIAYEQSPEIASEIAEKTPVEALKAIRNKQMTATGEEKLQITDVLLSGQGAKKIIAEVKDILPKKETPKTPIYVREDDNGCYILSGTISMIDLVKLQNSGIFDVRLDG